MDSTRNDQYSDLLTYYLGNVNCFLFCCGCHRFSIFVINVIVPSYTLFSFSMSEAMILRK